MFCGNCGSKLDNNGLCSNCSQTTVSTNSQGTVEEKPKKTINKKFIIIGLVTIGIILIALLVFLLPKGDKPKDDKKRSEVLTNLEKSEYLKFTIGGNDFYLGDKISTYKSKNISYDDTYVDENSKIASDSIMSQTFYNEDEEAQFLGALYCQAGDECSYDDSIMIKINFYEDSDVIVNDYIKFGMYYEDIVEKYGKEDGTFYQDSELLVWTFGEKGKVGEPYYVLRFDEGGWFSLGDLTELRIGVWWYEGEYEHTVIKNTEGDK